MGPVNVQLLTRPSPLAREARVAAGSHPQGRRRRSTQDRPLFEQKRVCASVRGLDGGHKASRSIADDDVCVVGKIMSGPAGPANA